MSLQPHQERVITERDDLQQKIKALDRFTGSDTFRSLKLKEQYRMVRQLNHMRSYCEVLNERIEDF
jgi:hypothetical protein